MKLNELAHKKLSFSSLSVEGVFQDEWLQYQVRCMDRWYLTLALVASDLGPQTWVSQRSNVLTLPVDFMAFKAGPVYEAEQGFRLVGGKALTAEAYLNFYDKLEAEDLLTCGMKLFATISVPAGKKDSIYAYRDHTWDHQDSTIETEQESIKVTVPLDSPKALVFLTVLGYPPSISVESCQSEVVECGSTIDMFA